MGNTTKLTISALYLIVRTVRDLPYWRSGSEVDSFALFPYYSFLLLWISHLLLEAVRWQHPAAISFLHPHPFPSFCMIHFYPMSTQNASPLTEAPLRAYSSNLIVKQPTTFQKLHIWLVETLNPCPPYLDSVGQSTTGFQLWLCFSVATDSCGSSHLPLVLKVLGDELCPPQKYVKVLTPTTLRCDLIWRVFTKLQMQLS